jgi:hypothetical protein
LFSCFQTGKALPSAQHVLLRPVISTLAISEFGSTSARFSISLR